MDVKEQQEFIKNCYNNCDGYSSNCSYYKQELISHQDKNKYCSVYKTIQNDVIKIKEGKKNITYSTICDLVK